MRVSRVFRNFRITEQRRNRSISLVTVIAGGTCQPNAVVDCAQIGSQKKSSGA